MRLAALYRVSTERQENEGASLDAQQRRFRELAAANGWTVVAEFRGQESAAKAASERAVLQRLYACIREQDVDAVWVIEQSRLTRGDELEMALLIRELVEREVSVIVGTETINLQDIGRRMVFRIQSAVDEAERDRIRERFRRGRREKARQGRKTGGKSPYGYRNPPAGDPRRGTLQPHPEEAAVVRRIFRDLSAGVTLRALAARLTDEGIPAPRGGTWGRSTLRRLLESPVYLGTQVCGVWQVNPESGAVRLDLDHPDAIVVPDAHEALVTRSERDAALARLRSTGNGRPELLTGLLYLDGLRAGVDGGHGVSFYRPIGERGAWLPVEDLNETVWRGFHALLTEPESVAALLSAYRADQGSRGLGGELAAALRHRDRLTARLARLVEMRADGEIGRDEHARLSHETRRALKASERTEAEIRERMAASASVDLDRMLDELGALVDEDLTGPERRRILSHLVGSVHVESRQRSEGQRRSRGGRFGPAPGPAWRAEAIYLRLRPGPASRTIDCGCGQSGTLVAIVRDGRALVVPRIMTEGVQHA